MLYCTLDQASGQLGSNLFTRFDLLGVNHRPSIHSTGNAESPFQDMDGIKHLHLLFQIRQPIFCRFQKPWAPLFQISGKGVQLKVLGLQSRLHAGFDRPLLMLQEGMMLCQCL